jgi:uncharacterized RmlC-like cupin family protein
MIPQFSRQGLGLCRKLCSRSSGCFGRHCGHQSRAEPADELRIPRIVDHSVHANRDHALQSIVITDSAHRESE